MPLTPISPVVPLLPASSCPPKRNRHVRMDAPPCPLAVTVYSSRLTPCMHSPQSRTAASSLTTDTCKVATGRILSGT